MEAPANMSRVVSKINKWLPEWGSIILPIALLLFTTLSCLAANEPASDQTPNIINRQVLNAREALTQGMQDARTSVDDANARAVLIRQQAEQRILDMKSERVQV